MTETTQPHIRIETVSTRGTHLFTTLTAAESDLMGSALFEAANCSADIQAVLVTYPCGTQEVWDVTQRPQTDKTIALS